MSAVEEGNEGEWVQLDGVGGAPRLEWCRYGALVRASWVDGVGFAGCRKEIFEPPAYRSWLGFVVSWWKKVGESLAWRH